MTNEDLLEVLNSYDSRNPIRMIVLIEQGSRGCRPLGFLKGYDFIESQNTLSFYFIDGSCSPILSPLFSHYLISDVKATGAVNPGGVVLSDECRGKITKIKTGILELLKISEPLLKRLERELLT
jgi:hypothetical protein